MSTYPPRSFGNWVQGPERGLCFSRDSILKTYVYVDGFNLYYGAVKGTPHKWLDLATMCKLLLPAHDIAQIRYFTALVSPRPPDMKQRQRQQTYLRALATLPKLTIHYGSFLSKTKWRPLAHPPAGGPRMVEILDMEEKGSDVNLASYLLRDGFRGDYEVAVIVSNDSDLVHAMEIVRDELNLPVGLLNPHKNPSVRLLPIASFYKPVRSGVLAVSQFPEQMQDLRGQFHKPPDW
jgi:uncharacterized LabA/DUF88 family protein